MGTITPGHPVFVSGIGSITLGHPVHWYNVHVSGNYILGHPIHVKRYVSCMGTITQLIKA